MRAGSGASFGSAGILSRQVLRSDPLVQLPQRFHGLRGEPEKGPEKGARKGPEKGSGVDYYDL